MLRDERWCKKQWPRGGKRISAHSLAHILTLGASSYRVGGREAVGRQASGEFGCLCTWRGVGEDRNLDQHWGWCCSFCVPSTLGIILPILKKAYTCWYLKGFSTEFHGLWLKLNGLFSLVSLFIWEVLKHNGLKHGSWIQLPGCETCLQFLLCLWPWMTCLISPCLGFLIHKKRD